MFRVLALFIRIKSIILCIRAPMECYNTFFLVAILSPRLPLLSQLKVIKGISVAKVMISTVKVLHTQIRSIFSKEYMTPTILSQVNKMLLCFPLSNADNVNFLGSVHERVCLFPAVYALRQRIWTPTCHRRLPYRRDRSL